MIIYLNNVNNTYPVSGIWLDYTTKDGKKGALNYTELFKWLKEDETRLNHAENDIDYYTHVLKRMETNKREDFPIIVNCINDYSIAEIIGSNKTEDIRQAKDKTINYIENGASEQINNIGNSIQGIVTTIYNCYFNMI